MIDERRLSEQIQEEIGYEPPSPSFTSPGYLSHRLAVRPDPHPSQHLQNERLLALVAALLAIAIVVGLVWTVRALHKNQTVPVNNPRPAPGTALVPIGNSWFFSASDGALVASPTQSPNDETLLITHDGGRTWVRAAVNLDPMGIYKLEWQDAQHILLVESAGPPAQLATTADGGYHWQSTKIRLSSQLQAMFFLDPHEGWALCALPGAQCWGVDSNSALYHTIDSGAHWQQLGPSIAFPSTLPYDIAFTNADSGFMGASSSDGVGRLVTTEDGGKSWHLIELPPPPGGWPSAAEMAAARNSTAPVCVEACVELPAMFGSLGVLELEIPGGEFTYTTTDGGLTWGRPRALPGVPLQCCGGVNALDPTNWWIVDGAGSLFRTQDEGKVWQRIETRLPTHYTLISVTPVGGNVLWGSAVTSFGHNPSWAVPVRSIDGGANWSFIDLPAK